MPNKESLAESDGSLTQCLHKSLENYLRYHRIQGSTADTLRDKKKDLGPFLNWLEQQVHKFQPQSPATFIKTKIRLVEGLKASPSVWLPTAGLYGW